ncbi:DNA-binding response regulator [Stenotrophomonas sp. 278]|nr:DNA-binding response regulator [Stenotrophomonas sp. 278]
MFPPTSSPLSNRIALVEDHARLASLVERGLSAAGIAVDTFTTLESAWHGIARQSHALVVIDRGLPDDDGLELVRRMRAAGNQVPCLMLTARDALHDRVDGGPPAAPGLPGGRPGGTTPPRNPSAQRSAAVGGGASDQCLQCGTGTAGAGLSCAAGIPGRGRA